MSRRSIMFPNRFPHAASFVSLVLSLKSSHVMMSSRLFPCHVMSCHATNHHVRPVLSSAGVSCPTCLRRTFGIGVFGSLAALHKLKSWGKTRKKKQICFALSPPYKWKTRCDQRCAETRFRTRLPRLRALPAIRSGCRPR